MLKQLWIDVRVWFVTLFRRSELDRRTDEEIQFHLAMREQRLIESGVPPADARQQARRQLGNATLLAESSREAWGWTGWSSSARTLRYAFRTMASNRLFTFWRWFRSRWASGQTRRYTASWTRSCCAPCRCPIPHLWCC